MQRLFVLVLIALLVLGVGSVYATPLEDLNALVVHYGADTLVFGSMRMDDGFFEALDGLVQRIIPFLPPEQQAAPVTMPMLLDMAAQNGGADSFAEDIRPWLGDTLSFGMTLNPNDINDVPYVTIAMAVEGSGARDFIAQAMAASADSERFIVSEVNGFTLYTPANEFDETYVAIGDTVLFVASAKEALPLETVSEPLSDSADFDAAMALLPETDYDAVLYFNGLAMRDIFAQMPEMQDTSMMFNQWMLASAGGQAAGFKIMNGDTLVFDAAQSVDLAAIEGFVIQTYESGPVDLSFANHVPADTPFVIHSSDAGPTIQAAYNQVRALGDWLKDNGGLSALIDPSGTQMTPEEAAMVNQFDPAMLLGMVNFVFAGGTGLSLERDVFPALDGDVAFYVRGLAVEDFFMSPIVPDLGLIFQTSDTNAALHLVDVLTESAAAYEVPTTVENYGTGRALVLSSMELAMGSPYPGLDVLVGASDGVFAVGTRPAVNAALQTSGGLADDATFQTASQYFLPGSQQVWYFATAPLLDLVPGLLANQQNVDAEAVDSYRLISLLESASLSAVGTDEGVTSFRFVLALADTPRELPIQQ